MSTRSNFKTSESYNPACLDGYAIYDGPAEEITFSSTEFFNAWFKRTGAILFGNRPPVSHRAGTYLPVTWVLGPCIYMLQGHYYLPVITPVAAQVIVPTGQSITTADGTTTKEDRRMDAVERNLDATVNEMANAIQKQNEKEKAIRGIGLGYSVGRMMKKSLLKSRSPTIFTRTALMT